MVHQQAHQVRVAMPRRPMQGRTTVLSAGIHWPTRFQHDLHRLGIILLSRMDDQPMVFPG